ncbi:uncharacterized protein [Anabrus simplex]|uniref:uncharacterized protein n=1 Tax=Anabrus simplex TaxID=316456 RepID=UPI0035A26C8D
MRAGLHIVLGVFLVLATSLLTGSAVGERHIRRITAADLPALTNSSGPSRTSNSNNNVLKTLESSPVTNCSTGGTNGSCGEALPEEAKRKAKDKLPELSSDDSHSVFESSSDETLQERLHSGILLHLTTAAPDYSHEGSLDQDRGTTYPQSTTPSKEVRTSSYRDHDVNAEIGRFDSSLTTPRVSLIDDRFLRVSESIKQNLEDLEEQHVFRPTSTPSSQNLETTSPSSSGYIPPTSGDISPPNGTKVAFEYTNHVSIQYNDTFDPPRRLHKDIVVENGSRVEFTSSYIHTEQFGESPPTTPASAVEEESANSVDGKTSDHNSVTDTLSNSNNTSQDNTVEEANLSENAVHQQKNTTNTSEYLQSPVTSSYSSSEYDNFKDIHNNTVPPGDIHSTTSSRPSSRSQQTTEGSAAAFSSEETSTVDSKLSKRRYTTRKLYISGVPSSTPATPAESSVSSTQRSRSRQTIRRTTVSTTSETESSTLPPTVTTSRTRARMISSARHQVNATNSVEELPTLTPAGSNGQQPRRKQNTRYSWQRPLNRTENSSEDEKEEDEETELSMVRIQISTVQPSSSQSSYRNNLIRNKKVQNGTDGRDVDFTTEATRYIRRKEGATDEVNNQAKVDTEKEDAKSFTSGLLSANKTVTLKRTLQKDPAISSNEVVVKNSSQAIRNRGSIKFSGLSTLTGGMVDSLLIPPTAAAWALATLRGPADTNSTGVVQRPSKNDTDDEITTTVQPEVGAETTTDSQWSEPGDDRNTSSPTGNSSSEGATTSVPLEDLLTLGFVPTQRAFEEVGASARSDLVYVVGEDTQSSASEALPTPEPDRIQNSGMEIEEENISTTTNVSSEEMISTTQEEGTVGVTGSDTTTVSTSSEVTTSKELLGNDQATVTPTTTNRPSFTTDSPASVTMPVTEFYSTTDIIPKASTLTSPLMNATTSEPELVTEILVVTLSHEHGVGVAEGEDVDENDLLDTTLPPTTTALPHGVVLGDADLGEDGHPHNGDGEEPDYVAEIDAQPTADPKLQTTSTSTIKTTTLLTFNGEDDKTTTEMPVAETTTTQPFTTEEPEITTISWYPSFGDITSYLRVTVFSTWEEVCQERRNFKEALARLIADKMDRKLSARNVVLANVGLSQCEDMVSTVKEERQLIDVNVFILDEEGVFSRELNDMFYVLVAPKNFPTPLEIKNVELLHGALPATNESSNAGVIAAITISCIGAVCLLLLAVLLIIMRKRQKRFNYGQRCTPVSLDAYSLDSVSVYDSVRRKGGHRASKRSYGNPGFDDPGAPSHPMNFAGLANFSSDRAALEEEFGMVPQIAPKSDELPEGAETKNRYSNVIPLPETRVPLTPIEGEPLSDYINANYVRGPKNEQKFYIACQAPLQSTVTDFWRMVWEQQSKVILMLTDLVENGVEKCADYLPPSEVLDCHRLFGDFQITLKKREEREKYVISTLQLKNLETNLWREVTHLWYLSWPHQGVPEETNSIIAFLIEARPFMKANTGPNIVHCSPGTGRTGTVLACDICIREFEQSRMVDIPRCVYRLRRDRAGAVKTRDQYVFIYQVLNTYATKLTGGGGLDSI